MILQSSDQKSSQGIAAATVQAVRRAKPKSSMRVLWPLLLAMLALIAWVADASLSLVYSLAYMAIALAPRALRAGAQTAIDPFEPYFGLSLLFYLYSISTIQFVETYQVTYYNEAVSSSALVEFAVSCLLGQLGLALGYLASRKENLYRIKSRAVGSADVHLRILLGPALILALLLLPLYIDRFNFLNVVSYADAALESRLVRMENTAAGIADVLLRDPYVLLVLCASTVLLFDRRRFLLRLIAIGVLSAYLITNFLSGWRGQFVFAALLPIIFFHYRVRRLPMAMIVIGGLFSYLLINALSVMRSASAADLSMMFAVLRENMSESGLAFLRLSSSGELATSTNLLRLIMGVQNGETELFWGGQLLSQIGAFVPRVLWPDRPPLANELFVQVFYPGVYESGAGYGLFFHQEGYWDFGLPGVVLYAFMLSWLTRWIYKKLIFDRGGPFWILLYAVLYGQLVLSVVRTGFVGSIKMAIMAALPLLIIALLGNQKRKRMDSD